MLVGTAVPDAGQAVWRRRGPYVAFADKGRAAIQVYASSVLVNRKS